MMIRSYGYMGWVEFCGALFCYYAICNDFSFRPSDMQFKANQPIWLSSNVETDVYNPTLQSFGNSIAQNAINTNKCTDASSFDNIDWVYMQHSHVDLRVVALNCHILDGRVSIVQAFNWG